MSERGLPTEGAPACPFVAFEDDRDGRATVPDHRHRCFAEPRPAPRALAHQEAYCLSSAFPVCPTFQDWARREAAAARTVPAAGAQPPDEPPESHPMPPLDRDPQHAADIPPLAPRRNPPRDWAAPPPWTGDSPGAEVAGAAGAAGAAYAAGAYASGQGPEPDAGAASRDEPATPADVAPVSAPADPTPSSESWGDPSRGLAGSAAYRLAGPDPDEPDPATPEPAGTPAPGDPYEYPPVAARGNPAPEPAPRQQPPRRQPSRQQPPRGQAKPATPSQADPDAAAHRPDAAELFGPAWERPRRYEAYPTLRTRIGLPSFRGVPKLGLAALALILGALFVFLFGPAILGFGQNDPGAGTGATPAPSAEATATPAPTEPPAPTPQVYTVRQGDTMSKIANKFDVTVEDLLAANPQIKNPDTIKIGDKVTIPTSTGEGGDGSAEP